jgi:signal transduction histidine kinase
MMNSNKTKRFWNIIILILAFDIVIFTVWNTRRLVNELSREEENKVRLWAEAVKLLNTGGQEDGADYTAYTAFLVQVLQNNKTIPVILTDNKGNVIQSLNIDSAKAMNPGYLQTVMEEMRLEHDPIEIEFLPGQKNYIYYRNSTILSQLEYYPFFQIGIIAVFLVVAYIAFNSSRRSEQNQVWVGLAKETAHQLGTPISSLMAWMDYLKSTRPSLTSGKEGEEDVVREIEKDIQRLEIITERFSKIGSVPALSRENISDVMTHSLDYLRNRSSQRVKFVIEKPQREVYAMINIYLFDWVVENICKNAIDAMSGEGQITVRIVEGSKTVTIELTDTGKGMPSSLHKRIFKPGFTTKKRGWGLGLSLARRIIEDYHKGKIFVKDSVINKGTTFAIVLKK